MKLTTPNKSYKIKINQEGSISIYTALILDEDETHIKFKDKFGEELTYHKDQIMELKCLD